MSRVDDSTHGIGASLDHDHKEKREERRGPKRGRKMSPNEAARGPKIGPERPLGFMAPRPRPRAGW